MKKLGFIFLVILIVAVFGLMNGCDKKSDKKSMEQKAKYRISQEMDCDSFIISVNANFSGERINYYYRFDRTGSSLQYVNKFNEYIHIHMFFNNNIVSTISISEDLYSCFQGENKSLCNKAQKKVDYWKNIMKLDERLKSIPQNQPLSEKCKESMRIKKKSPEERLN